MRAFVGVLAVAVAACAGQAALAQSYKATDIVSHFAPPANLGGTRALCIGTESECAKDLPSAKPTGGFDLVINFEYNSDNLTRSAKKNLDEFAKALKDPRLSKSGFVVEGHTDGTGSEDFNLGLSNRRASAVVSYLEARGVPADRLEAKGFGKQRLLVEDPASPSNRRVETRLRTE